MTTWTDLELSFDGHVVTVAELSWDGLWDGLRAPPSRLVHTTVEAVAQSSPALADELLELARREFRAAAHARLSGWPVCASCWRQAVDDPRLHLDPGVDYRGDGPPLVCALCDQRTWSPVRLVAEQ